MNHDPVLLLCYIGRSGAVETVAISAKAAARRWPELFRQLAREMSKEAERAEARQGELPGMEVKI